MKKNLIILLTLVIGIGSLNAQSLKRFKIKATEAFEAKDFSRALEYYQLIINDAEDETTENFYNAGEAAREFRIYGLAEQYYRTVLADTTFRSSYPLTNFHLASVLKNQGKYKDAIRYFQLFLDKNASLVGENYTAKAKKELRDCEWALTLPAAEMSETQLDSTVNTPNSEFSPFLLGNQLYFSSVRYKTNSEHLPEAPLTRLYISEDNKQAEQVSEDFNEDLMHTAHTAFNEDASKVYYTICSSVNAADVQCKIYYREKSGDKWGKRVVLSDKINTAGYTATQPNIGYDKTTGKELLFFVSDRPVDENDSKRDLNVWCSYKEGDYFDAPVYIANINTDEDDVTPFFESESQTLYFSSKGHQNMGGFDIYSIDKKENGWEMPEHLPQPMNSSYDDLYYTFSSEGDKAYLSSNRASATCDDENNLCGCNDIYEVPQLAIKIKVLTFNSITGLPLNGVTVVLDEKAPEAISSSPITNSKSNEFDYSGKLDLKYFTLGTLDGYVQDDSLFSTFNLKGGSRITIPLYLTPTVDLDAFTFSKSTLKPLTGVKVELIELSGDPMFEGDSRAQQDGNKYLYNYDINYKKRYMVVGSKFGYSRDSFLVDTETIPIEPWHIVDSLYLCKAPPELTKLYFYNDEPNRRNRSTKTNWSYVKAYDLLTASTMKDSFVRELSSEPEELGKSLKYFKDVEDGMVLLDSFTNLLLTDPSYLGNSNVKVIVRGFASPRAKNDYNFRLTKRRINSIKNYFEEKGLLQKYPGQIIFDPNPNGEDKAPKGLVDDIKDRKKSIYYEGVSRERRVEIVWILDAPDACPQKEKKPEDSNGSFDR